MNKKEWRVVIGHLLACSELLSRRSHRCSVPSAVPPSTKKVWEPVQKGIGEGKQ